MPLPFRDVKRIFDGDKAYLEEGYIRNNDGSWYVSVITDFGNEVNGDMFDWWFRNCDNTEKYRWWHPKDHITGTWDNSYFDISAKERKKGYYINHIHIVREKINNVTQDLQILFIDPMQYFDQKTLDDNKVSAILMARVHADDDLIGKHIAVGYLIHYIRIGVKGNNELVSKFWLGCDVRLRHVQRIFKMINSFDCLTPMAMKLPLMTTMTTRSADCVQR